MFQYIRNIEPDSIVIYHNQKSFNILSNLSIGRIRKCDEFNSITCFDIFNKSHQIHALGAWVISSEDKSYISESTEIYGKDIIGSYYGKNSNVFFIDHKTQHISIGTITKGSDRVVQILPVDFHLTTVFKTNIIAITPKLFNHIMLFKLSQN